MHGADACDDSPIGVPDLPARRASLLIQILPGRFVLVPGLPRPRGRSPARVYRYIELQSDARRIGIISRVVVDPIQTIASDEIERRVVPGTLYFYILLSYIRPVTGCLYGKVLLLSRFVPLLNNRTWPYRQPVTGRM